MWITVFAVTTGISLSCVVLALVNEYREDARRLRDSLVSGFSM
jgi:hypothetical protein